MKKDVNFGLLYSLVTVLILLSMGTIYHQLKVDELKDIVDVEINKTRNDYVECLSELNIHKMKLNELEDKYVVEYQEKYDDEELEIEKYKKRYG